MYINDSIVLGVVIFCFYGGTRSKRKKLSQIVLLLTMEIAQNLILAFNDGIKIDQTNLGVGALSSANKYRKISAYFKALISSSIWIIHATTMLRLSIFNHQLFAFEAITKEITSCCALISIKKKLKNVYYSTFRKNFCLKKLIVTRQDNDSRSHSRFTIFYFAFHSHDRIA